jgi:hypothetical protein
MVKEDTLQNMTDKLEEQKRREDGLRISLKEIENKGN